MFTKIKPKDVLQVKQQYRSDPMFQEKLKKVASLMGATFADNIEDVTEDTFVAAGFTPLEAAVLMFGMCEDYKGRAVTSIEMLKQWLRS